MIGDTLPAEFEAEDDDNCESRKEEDFDGSDDGIGGQLSVDDDAELDREVGICRSCS